MTVFNFKMIATGLDLKNYHTVLPDEFAVRNILPSCAVFKKVQYLFEYARDVRRSKINCVADYLQELIPGKNFNSKFQLSVVHQILTNLFRSEIFHQNFAQYDNKILKPSLMQY